MRMRITFACHMKDLTQSIAHKLKIFDEIKLQTYFKLSVQEDVNSFPVELHFWHLGEGFWLIRIPISPSILDFMEKTSLSVDAVDAFYSMEQKSENVQKWSYGLLALSHWYKYSVFMQLLNKMSKLLSFPWQVMPLWPFNLDIWSLNPKSIPPLLRLLSFCFWYCFININQ